jgi:MoaA/NifB/PqqE/SkfB family radical SAM enzyme
MKNHIQKILYILWLDLRRVTLKTKYFAEIDITDNCNLRCKHCYHFQGRKDVQAQELPISVWEKRLNELYKLGIRAVLLVGGEPALRPDVLMLADKIFPFVYVITNGTIKISEKFNHRLFVSLDGLPNTTDYIRGNDVFSKVMKNYSGDRRVIINMTLTTRNFNDLGDVTRIAKENGFDGVVCNICAGGVEHSSPMVVRLEERAAIVDEMKRIKAIYPDCFLMTKGMIRWYEFPDHRGSCTWGNDALHFDVSWNKRGCFMDNPDCSNCGCLAGSLQSPLKMLRALRRMVKIGVYP